MIRSAFLVAGAACSMALTLYAGRHNRSNTLVAIFVLWVLAPYAALAWARAKPALALLVSVASVAIYAATAFGVLHAKIGFVFLVVPAASLAAAAWAKLTRL